ncbi:MAG: tRNA (N(6)-L-threonylcarbamoyladenosine(37)-C(2))-methylthiotransferase [bacterium]|nr:tRNA (N(6)-L-threonylcarbamoyladenosine(37)-C(2))-methylthiotransferase [bacterium]
MNKPPAEQIKVYLEHYGCTANRLDSEILAGLLEQAGYQLVSSPKEANVAIINTCIVKGPTQRKMERRIRELYSRLPVIVAGCFPQALKEYLIEKFPGISLVGCYSLHRIAEAVEAALSGRQCVFTDIEVTAEEKLALPKCRFNPLVEIVVIADGCIGACDYCVVKLARGWLKSASKEKIAKRIKHAVEKEGVKEVFLTAQDTGIYGLDINSSLVELLKEILSSTNKFFKLRIGMMNPRAFMLLQEELLELFEDERLYRFLHLPVQTGSNRLLQIMNRLYRAEEFLEAVKAVREFDKFFTVITDIIVGHPLETEEDYQQTLELVKEAEPDNVFVSRFEPRPWTRAAEYRQLPGWLVKRRSRELVRLVHELARKRNEQWIGKKTRILVDKEPDARNDYYKIVVTGDKFAPGEVKEVVIRGADHQQLYINS